MNGRLTDLLQVPEPRRSRLLDVVEQLMGARRVVLTTHVNADGDGTGSQAAVAAWLQDRGVEVTIVNPSSFPDAFRFLLPNGEIVAELTDPRSQRAIEQLDMALVLDTSEANRITPLDQLLDPARTFVVDHHPAGPAVVGQGGVQDPSAAATGELVYDMITLSGDDWPAASVLGIYVAIVTDTGSFRFGNTTPRAHAIAADLLSKGVDPEEVYRRLFAVAPPRRIHLLRAALDRLEHEPDLGLAWMVLPSEVTSRLGSTSNDYDGLIDHARSIEGTRAALLFREIGPEETKVSLRSSGSTDVNRIARAFGGGGHAKAAGASIPLPVAEAVPLVLEAVREALREESIRGKA